MTGNKLTSGMINDSLTKFLKRPEIRVLCEQNGLSAKLFNNVFLSFRRYCNEQDPLPPELHIVFYDLAHGQGNDKGIILRYIGSIFVAKLSFFSDFFRIWPRNSAKSPFGEKIL